MNNISLEKERKVYKVLHRKFIVLRRKYVLGVFPILLCCFREEIDGTITEHKIARKIKRYGAYPEYNAILSIELNGVGCSYVIDKYSYQNLNFRDKPVWYEINNAMPYLEG